MPVLECALAKNTSAAAKVGYARSREMRPHRVAARLAEDELHHPELAVLVPNIDEYSVILHQPKGEVLLTAQRVGNRDQEVAIDQYKKLFAHSAEEQIQLLVTPEYSVPWQALTGAILEGSIPATGCLWALGCESLTVAQLDEIVTQLRGTARVLFEDFDRTAAAARSFFDPLAYVFRTRANDGSNVLVVLIQFKTHPCVEADHIEVTQLIRGRDVYVFGTVGETIRLFSFICSDVLSDVQPLLDCHNATLILHIQLNPRPRDSTFRDYRKRLFAFTGDQTELICLNWAADVRGWSDVAAQPAEWGNIAGSAWLLRPDRFANGDAAIAQNHRRGLYYTWHRASRCHALFLNNGSASYRLVSTKVWHHRVPAVQSKRTGPRLESLLRWDAGAAAWRSETTADDGFANLINPWSAQTRQLHAIYQRCPIAAERLLALLQGAVMQSPSWYHLKILGSFTIDEPEHVRRITFAQDPEAECVQYRENHVRHFVTCQQILDAFTAWPPEFDDVRQGYQFTWEPEQPNSSVRSTAGRPATLIYVGENPSLKLVKAIGDALRAGLKQAGELGDRLGIFYREGTETKLWRHPDSRRIDQPASSSPKSFTDAS